MIEKISAIQTNTTYKVSQKTDRACSATVVKQDEFSKDILSSTTTESSGIYTKPAGVKPDSVTVNRLKQEVEKSMDSLRDYVEKLIANQGNAKSLTMNADAVNQAKQAISADGEWGVKAVSDRIVEFAKAICGNDKSKIETIKSAIEKGFGEAGKAMNSTLPDICNQTHDEVMKKLDAWVNESEN